MIGGKSDRDISIFYFYVNELRAPIGAYLIVGDRAARWFCWNSTGIGVIGVSILLFYKLTCVYICDEI